MSVATEIDTKNTTGRRTVSYQSYEDLLSDAQRLADSEVKMLGNWSLGQILEHLGRSLDASIDGTGFQVSLPMRIVGSLFFKGKFLNQTLPAGFKIGKQVEPKFLPDEGVTIEEGLDHLRRAIARCQQESTRATHPLFGNLSTGDWDKFNLRHAEMHMSFAVPV